MDLMPRGTCKRREFVFGFRIVRRHLPRTIHSTVSCTVQRQYLLVRFVVCTVPYSNLQKGVLHENQLNAWIGF